MYTNNKTRILYIIYTLDAGGIESMGMNIFRNIDRDHYTFDFVVVKDKSTHQLYDDEVVKLGGNILPVGKCKANKLVKYFSTEADIRNIIKYGHYDAVHINSGHVHTLPEVYFSKKYGIKNILVHSHNGGLDSSAKYYKLRCFLQSFYRTIIANYATYLLTCSDLAAKWSFPENSQYIQINNGIDIEKYTYNKEKRNILRKKIGIGNEILFGHIGRMNIQKNHKFLLKIFECILHKEKNSKLILCGTGELEQELRQYVKEKRMEDNVIFYGVSNDIPMILSAIDVFIFPSLFEGLPVVGIEAQASGVPIIASDTITRKVAITDAWHFISLDSSVQEWANNALKLVGLRFDTKNQLIDAGFDIRNTVGILESLYKA